MHGKSLMVFHVYVCSVFLHLVNGVVFLLTSELCHFPSCSGKAVVPSSPHRYQVCSCLDFSNVVFLLVFHCFVLAFFSNNIFSIIYLYFSHFFSGFYLRFWLDWLVFFLISLPFEAQIESHEFVMLIHVHL